MGAPVVTPFRFVVALDGEDQLLAEGRNRVDPIVVPVGEVRGWGEELDDRTHRTLRREDRTMVDAVKLGIGEPRRVVPMQDVIDGIHVGLEIRRVGIAPQEGVRYGLGDLRLSTTGYRAALMQGRRIAVGALEVPLVVGIVVDHVNPVTGGGDVLGVSAHSDRVVTVIPADSAVTQAELGPTRHQDDVVDIEYPGLAVAKHLEVVRIGHNDVGNRLVADWGGVFLALVVGDVGAGAAGMLLLGQPEQVS